jgi:hypothetical protein
MRITHFEQVFGALQQAHVRFLVVGGVVHELPQPDSHKGGVINAK